jgi:phenylpyruvate tautomerase PptA (4-oxalocrotonate tautomerase family)
MIYHTTVKLCKMSHREQKDEIIEKVLRIINEVYKFHKKLVFC